jgi:hypothetical protein
LDPDLIGLADTDPDSGRPKLSPKLGKINKKFIPRFYPTALF